MTGTFQETFSSPVKDPDHLSLQFTPFDVILVYSVSLLSSSVSLSSGPRFYDWCLLKGIYFVLPVPDFGMASSLHTTGNFKTHKIKYVHFTNKPLP